MPRKAIKGACIMATVKYKNAVYQIGPSATQDFTFWWDSTDPIGYFDVSIQPDPNPNNPIQKPLVEVQRAYYWDGTGGPETIRNVMLLTLRNDNNFAIDFIANHVLIYN
jgi:hypothetical protein